MERSTAGLYRWRNRYRRGEGGVDGVRDGDESSTAGVDGEQVGCEGEGPKPPRLREAMVGWGCAGLGDEFGFEPGFELRFGSEFGDGLGDGLVLGAGKPLRFRLRFLVGLGKSL